jgi:uncharacterized iron-regulated membrane protein
MLFAHRWLTFLLGVVLVLVAGSGALLVYQHDIDDYLNEGRYEVTPGDVGWRTVKENVEGYYPDMHLGILWWPQPDKPVYEAGFYGEDDAFKRVVVDPGTGEVVTGTREPNRIMDQINSFHTTLLSGEIGYWLVLASTVAGLFLAITGVYLWWPGIRRLVHALRVRGRTFYLLNYDLHQVSGALTAPAFLLMCVTGIAIAFPDATTRTLHAVTGEEEPEEVYWSRVESDPKPPGYEPSDRPDYDRLLERAHEEVPGARTFYVTFPEEPTDPIHIRLHTGQTPEPWGIVSRLAYDRYTGELIQVVDPRHNQTLAENAQEWVGPLHYGRFWGHWGRGFYILTCVVVIGLFGGGLYIWWAKRQRRRSGKAEADARQNGDPASEAATRPVTADLPGAGSEA